MLPLLGAVVAILVGLLVVGLAVERSPRVFAALARMNRLTPPQRGRLGVWIARDRRVPALVRPLPLTAFVYWIAPIDLIPDFIPGVGYIDDRIAMALATWLMLATAPAVFEEHLARIEFLHEAEADQALDAAPGDSAG